MEVSNKRYRSRLKKIRNSILKHLDKTHWGWNPHWSNLLDQIDTKLCGMRQELHDRR